jgi:hypothetical protein
MTKQNQSMGKVVTGALAKAAGEVAELKVTIVVLSRILAKVANGLPVNERDRGVLAKYRKGELLMKSRGGRGEA